MNYITLSALPMAMTHNVCMQYMDIYIKTNK